MYIQYKGITVYIQLYIEWVPFAQIGRHRKRGFTGIQKHEDKKIQHLKKFPV